MLRQLPKVPRDPNLLVGAASADDAGVYRLDGDHALVQTVDFFTPIVDDAYLYGQIAAANSLSDVYAMGGRPLTALALLGVPADVVSEKIIARILSGGLAKATEARCVIVGGHTIRNPEPIYGLSVTGMVSPRRMITNAAARPGDWLVLTKPLGTGIITTGIKRGLTPAALAIRAISYMRQLNIAGAELAEKGLVRAGTDVTGFGLLGHLGSMCRSSGVGAEVDASKLPVIGKQVLALIEGNCIPGGSRENLKVANQFTEWAGAIESDKILAADAQTSGGLLLCVREKNLESVLRILKKHRTACAVVIGRIVASAKNKIRLVRNDSQRHE